MLIEAYRNLVQMLQSVEEDIAKAEGGNKAAGTRVRKAMQDVKNAAQDLRKKVLEERSASPAPGATPGEKAPS